jgi:hypothetical protein
MAIKMKPGAAKTKAAAPKKKTKAKRISRGNTTLAVHMCFASAFMLWRVPNCTQSIIQEALGISPTTCKRQLAMLSKTFGVEFEREGGLRYGYYTLLKPGILELETLYPFLQKYQPRLATRIERYCKKNKIALTLRKSGRR